MYKLSLENEHGDVLQLTNTPDYTVLEIDGLYPPSANIITSQMSLYDGSKFNSSKVNERQLEIAMAIEPDAETNRIALYRIVKTKRYIKVNYENGQRNVYVEGYVSDVNISFFEMKQQATISILCPEPYFRSAEEIIETARSIIPKLHFPFVTTATEPKVFSYYEANTERNVTNEGDVECGMIIEISCRDEVINPAIVNTDTLEYFRLTTTLEAGDVLYITTQRGQKRARVYRDGEYINLFNYIAKGSTWLQLQPGDNIFMYEADSTTAQYMEVRFMHQNLYEGV